MLRNSIRMMINARVHVYICSYACQPLRLDTCIATIFPCLTLECKSKRATFRSAVEQGTLPAYLIFYLKTVHPPFTSLTHTPTTPKTNNKQTTGIYFYAASLKPKLHPPNHLYTSPSPIYLLGNGPLDPAAVPATGDMFPTGVGALEGTLLRLWAICALTRWPAQSAALSESSPANTPAAMTRAS
jgi:hypothetical protein